LRFPEFSGEWEKRKLGDIAELTSSKRIYLSEYVDNGIPFYRGKEISELKQNIQPQDILYISLELYSEYKNKFGVPQINDILITAVGTLGNVLVIRNDNPFYFKDGNLIWLKRINVNSDFLAYLLEINKKALEASAIGSSQKALTMVELRKLNLLFPPNSEQNKIAAFLSQIDERIATQNKIIEDLKILKSTISKRLLLNESWERFQIADIASLGRGRVISSVEISKQRSPKYPVYSSQTSSDGIMGYLDTYDFDGEYVTWTTDGANAGTVFYRNGKFNCTNVCGTLKINSNHNPYFVALCLNLIARKYVFTNLANPKLMNNVMATIEIYLPDVKIQDSTSRILSSIDMKYKVENEIAVKYMKMKKYLLSNLFV